MQLTRNRMHTRLVGVLSEAVREYISFISRSYEIQEGYKSTKGTRHYGFIPSSTIMTLETLYRLYIHMDGSHRNKYSFLDIGCGIGNIVLLARKVGFDAYGLEYNEKIYDIAKRFLGESRIFKGDMTSFRDYDKYDVLYYYIPIEDGNVMESFAAKLAKAVKPGACIIPNGCSGVFHYSKEFDKLDLAEGSYSIYRKKEAQ